MLLFLSCLVLSQSCFLWLNLLVKLVSCSEQTTSVVVVRSKQLDYVGLLLGHDLLLFRHDGGLVLFELTVFSFDFGSKLAQKVL